MSGYMPVMYRYKLYVSNEVGLTMQDEQYHFLDFRLFAKVPISPYYYYFLVLKGYSKIEKELCAKT